MFDNSVACVDRFGAMIFATDDGTRAAAEFVVHGQYLKTDPGLPEAKGQTYILPAGGFFDVRDGKIARWTDYWDTALPMKMMTGEDVSAVVPAQY